MQQCLVYLIGTLDAGGSERQLCYLLQAMDRERYHPAVVVWSFREDQTYIPQIRALGVPLYYFPGGPSRIGKLGELRRILMQMKPGVVHSYALYLNVAAWWATLGADAVAIGSVRGDFFHEKQFYGPVLGRLGAYWPATQIFNSHTAAEQARYAKSPFVPRHIYTIRNGVDLHRFRPVPLPTTRPARVVGSGSLLTYKRWDRLLKAGSALKQRGLDCLISVAGEGPLGGVLNQQAQDLGVADRVVFRGYVDDIPGLLAEAMFLVHTSDTEGCPNVVMEAMACGRAVIATDVGDVPFIVEDGKTGFVVPRDDDMMLVERISTLLVNPDLCRQMGEAGRAKAERDFGLTRLVSETLDAYRAAGWNDCQ